MRRLARFAVLAAALACALLAAGCGNRIATRTISSTEGPYIDLDELKYQIQISRYLNPSDIEDRTYLLGLPTGTQQPKGDETWFGVFLRVQNSTDHTIPPANQFSIVDTQGNVYHPIPQDASVNPFAYVANPIPSESLIPQPDAIPSEGVIKEGALLLFKLKTESLQNRPLEFRFAHDNGTEAVIDLDV